MRAAAASLTLTPPADAAQDKATSVGITGTTEVNRTLYAYVYQGTPLCPAVASSNSGANLTPLGGSFEFAGSIAHSYTYTPTATGTYTVCAYVARSSVDTPDAVGRQTFAVRAATGSLTLTPAADAAQDKPTTVAITGTTEVNRTLYAYVYSGTPACPAVPAANSASNLTPLGGSFEFAGAISHSYSYTPTGTGAYTVCAYVGRSSVDVPDATAFTTFSVRRAAATAAVAMAGAATQNSPTTVAVSGTTEVSRYLYVYAVAGAACPATAAGNTTSGLTGYGATYLFAGSYTHTITWYPSGSGARRLCAYVTKSLTDTPDAVGALDVTVAPDPNAPAPSVPSLDAPFAGEGSIGVPTIIPLVGPETNLSAEHLNPAFRWQMSADPNVADTLRVQRNEPDGTTTKLIDATIAEYTAWEGVDGENDGEGVTGDTADIATVSQAGGVATLQFKEALPPGEYSWFVTRASLLYPDETDPVHSEAHTFTVLGPHLRSLSVRTSSSRGTRSNYPGQTTIDAKATAYARVKLAVRHGKRQSVFFFHTDKTGTSSVPLTWSCKRPGGVYRVAVTASDQYGATRHKNVSFRTVSRARCTQMRRREARARRAREHRRAVAERAAERRAARRQAARVRRFKSTCAAIGGRPTLIDRGDGMYWYCVAPYGGLLPVPGF